MFAPHESENRRKPFNRANFGRFGKRKKQSKMCLTTDLTTVYPTIEKKLINIRVWRSWERGWFGTIRPQVRSLSLGPTSGGSADENRRIFSVLDA